MIYHYRSSSPCFLSKAEKAQQRRQKMSPASRKTAHKGSKERMQRFRSKDKSRFGLQGCKYSPTRFVDAFVCAPVITPPAKVRVLSSKFEQKFELNDGLGTRAVYLRADGNHVSSISLAAEITLAFMTAGCSLMIRSVAEAKENGELPSLNRIMAMRPTDGYPDGMEEHWHLVEPPAPTIKGRGNYKGQEVHGKGKFLRYGGGAIGRGCCFYFWKDAFHADGSPISALVATGTREMNWNISRYPWNAPMADLYKANIVGGSHNVTQQCVLDTLKFWNAGPKDVLLDVGFGIGTVVLTAAAALRITAVGVEIESVIFNQVFDVLSNLNSVNLDVAV